MNSGKTGEAGRQLERLWASGTLTGLSDSQLLCRYVDARGRDAVAEAAFRELVNRHGPMVLAVCRQTPEASARRGRRLPGHVPGPGAQGPLDPGGRVAGPLALQRGLSHGPAGAGDRRAIPPHRRRADGGARRAFAGRRLSFRPPALAPRGAGSAPGQVPGRHRALPPRGQVARGGGPAAALADRHGEQPALARSAAPAVAAGTPRPGGLAGDALGELAGRHSDRRGVRPCSNPRSPPRSVPRRRPRCPPWSCPSPTES